MDIDLIITVTRGYVERFMPVANKVIAFSFMHEQRFTASTNIIMNKYFEMQYVDNDAISLNEIALFMTRQAE